MRPRARVRGFVPERCLMSEAIPLWAELSSGEKSNTGPRRALRLDGMDTSVPFDADASAEKPAGESQYVRIEVPGAVSRIRDEHARGQPVREPRPRDPPTHAWARLRAASKPFKEYPFTICQPRHTNTPLLG